MQNKTLADALVKGAATPMSLKSILSGWVGKTITLGDGGFLGAWLGADNWSGQKVGVKSALQLSTAWACVRLIAETLATLPIGVLRSQPDGAKVSAPDHQLHYLLRSQPNADMSAVDFWTAFVASLLLWGNAYVEKRVSGSVITSLEFLLPECVGRTVLASGAVEWRYNDPITGVSRIVPENMMWHTPAFSLDGRVGISPITFGANVFGGAMAADKASAATFTNGMKSPGVVTMAATLTTKQRDDVRKHVREVSAAGDVMVLEGSNGFHQLRMNPQDAELLATRVHSIEEICRWFRVWPGLVGHSSQGQTMWGSGVEQMMISFVVFVLRPWCVRIEQSARRSLLNPAERLTLSVEFALEGLLRGDSTTRAAFYSQMVQNGVMTRDDVRRLENLPMHGGNADVLTVQSNLLPIDLLGATSSDARIQAALKSWLGVTDQDDKAKP